MTIDTRVIAAVATATLFITGMGIAIAVVAICISPISSVARVAVALSLVAMTWLQ